MLDLSTSECSTLSTECTFQILGFLLSVSISSSVFLPSLHRNWLNDWNYKYTNITFHYLLAVSTFIRAFLTNKMGRPANKYNYGGGQERDWLTNLIVGVRGIGTVNIANVRPLNMPEENWWSRFLKSKSMHLLIGPFGNWEGPLTSKVYICETIAIMHDPPTI